MATAVFEVGAALFGACVGSFLNVVIHRLPQEDPARRSLGGRSHCPHCGVQIRWSDNVPVLGWLRLAGKARCCGQRISFRYPAIELLTAALFLLLALFPPGGAPVTVAADGALVLDGERFAALGFHAVFVALLVALTFIDIDTFLLPDALTKPGMAIGLLAGLWPGLAGPISADPGVSLAVRTFVASLVGMLVGGGLTWGVSILGTRLFRARLKELNLDSAMGFGDVKLMAMIGAFLGWQSVLVTMLLACVFGALIGGIAALFGGSQKIPFGPYLALGAVVTLFFREAIIEFLLVTWPQWQRDSQSAPWILSAVALICLVFLVVLLRKGRRLG